MEMKRCEEVMKELAGNPPEEQMKSLRVFGLPAIRFSKKVLLYAIFYLVKYPLPISVSLCVVLDIAPFAPTTCPLKSDVV